MITFRALLQTASGLYRDRKTGRPYLRHDLLTNLPLETLESPVCLHKSDRGVYLLQVGDGEVSYELFSRRQTPRKDAVAAV